MQQHAAANPDDIDIMQVLGAIRRNMMRLVLATVAAGVLTYMLLTMIAPKYTSEAEMAVMARDAGNPFKDPRSAGANTEALSTRMDKEAINTHIRALQSPDLATQIINQLGLAEKPEFNSALGPVDSMDEMLRKVGIGAPRAGEKEEDRVLNAFFERLAVFNQKDSRVISVRFNSIDPDLAAQAPNLLADIYRERLATAKVTENANVQEALGPKIEQLSAEVRAAQAEIATFTTQAGLQRGGSQKTPLGDQQLGDLTTELTRVKAARTAAEARARTARDLMRKGTPEIIPEVQRSTLIQSLIQQKVQVERDLLKASAAMKSAHPVIRQLRADLNAANRQVATEVANVVASLEKEAIVAAEQEASIATSLDEVKVVVADKGGDEAKLRQLEANANSKRGELERLQAQYEANRARADSAAVPVEVQVLTRARPSSVPVSPQKGPLTLLVMAGTLLFGLAGIIISGLSSGARGKAAGGARSNTPALTETADPRLPEHDQASPASHGPARAPVGHDAPATPPGAAHADASYEAATSALAMAAKAARRKTQEAIVPVNSNTRDEQAGNSMITCMTRAEDVASAINAAAASNETGFRTLMARGNDPVPAGIIVELAETIMQDAGQALLIDWAIDGKGIASELGLPRSPGFSDLMRGAASFSNTVSRIPGSPVHLIASGSAFAEGQDGLDGDQLNLVLDALDEAYEHIIVVAGEHSARILFETIQGRFDAGVALVGAATADAQTMVRPGQFLGFDVSDIELLCHAPGSGNASTRKGRAA